jgi:DNA-binding response OmpR family regulator
MDYAGNGHLYAFAGDIATGTMSYIQGPTNSQMEDQNKPGNILLVEGSAELTKAIETFLKFEHHYVSSIADEMTALSQLKAGEYDVIILGAHFSIMSGVEICQQYRGKSGKAPILMITATNAIVETLAAFDAGADDCLSHPFDLRELAARVRALLRRPAAFLPGDYLRVGSLSLYPLKRLVLREEEAISLMPREFQLLEFFMRHPDQVLTAEILLHNVWPTKYGVSPEALRITIKRLRKKIDPQSAYLRNIHGVGYILSSR